MSGNHLRELNKNLESQDLTEQQRETIQRFDKYKVNMGHWTSDYTRLNYARNLKYLGAYNQKPYKEMTERDITDFFDSRNFSDTTRNDKIISFRTFFGWLHGFPEGEGEYPDCIKNFKTPTLKEKITKSDLITDKEMKDMIRCAEPNYRDPALITALPESCFRPGEFVSMNIGDVEEKSYGFSITCRESKTVTRSVPIITSARYLAAWLNHHPFKDDPAAPLWISLARKNFGKRLEINTLNFLVKRIAKRAGIKKRVWAYLFRHTGITYYAAQGKSDAQLRLICGWSRTSNMPSRYTHLAALDAENAILEIHGLREKKSQSLLKPKVCPRCDEENNPEMTYCGKCATNLDLPLKNMSEYKELLRKQEENKRKLDILMAERDEEQETEEEEQETGEES